MVKDHEAEFVRQIASRAMEEQRRGLSEKIVVHAPDKSSGHRGQQVDIYYTFMGELTTSHEVV